MDWIISKSTSESFGALCPPRFLRGNSPSLQQHFLNHCSPVDIGTWKSSVNQSQYTQSSITIISL
jgi:hypothetical protein